MLHYLAYSGYVRGVRSQCLCGKIMLIISCTALDLCIETHESQPCLTLAKKPFYYGETFNDSSGKIWCTIKGKQSLFLGETDCSFFL